MKLNALIKTALLTLVLAAAGVAQAQNKESESTPKSAGNLITLKFGGGTAAEYAAAVRQAAGGVNILIAPEAQAVKMPPIDLNNVAITSALAVLEDRRALVHGMQVQLQYEIHNSGVEGEQPIHAIKAHSGKLATSSPETRVWSVAGALGMGVKPEDLLTAIQAALDMLGGDAAPAQLKFHEATGILIARANNEQLGAINDVIEQVKLAAQQRRAISENQQSAKSTEDRIRQLQERIADLEGQLAQKNRN